MSRNFTAEDVELIKQAAGALDFIKNNPELVGALLGGTTGAGIGAYTNKDNRLLGALIGGGAGAGVGAGGGYAARLIKDYIDKNKAFDTVKSKLNAEDGKGTADYVRQTGKDSDLHRPASGAKKKNTSPSSKSGIENLYGSLAPGKSEHSDKAIADANALIEQTAQDVNLGSGEEADAPLSLGFGKHPHFDAAKAKMKDGLKGFKGALRKAHDKMLADKFDAATKGLAGDGSIEYAAGGPTAGRSFVPSSASKGVPTIDPSVDLRGAKDIIQRTWEEADPVRAANERAMEADRAAYRRSLAPTGGEDFTLDDSLLGTVALGEGLSDSKVDQLISMRKADEAKRQLELQRQQAAKKRRQDAEVKKNESSAKGNVLQRWLGV